jgi:tRNA/tmRNA/rRNA uracil-C5-methylase (TrmA/RlmC/RlmD family)
VYQALDGDDDALSCVRSIEVRAWGDGAPDEESCSAFFTLEDPLSRGGRQRGVEARARLAKKLGALKSSMLVCCSDEPSSQQRLVADNGVYTYAPVGAFTQVNVQVNAKLVHKVVELAQSSGAKTFLDLYCGCGNFSLPLAFAGLTGTGVELTGDSIRAAQRAADEQDLRVKFHAAKVHDFLGTRWARAGDFDVAVLDPPRAGAKDLLGRLLTLKIPRLLMVSCEPGTLARDLQVLVQGGYQLSAVHVFDMFPQTHHVETLVLLTRS